MNTVEVLEKLSVVMLQNTIWTGARRMRPEDIRLGDGGQMPPEDVATLGSKKVCDPKALNIFHAIDNRMEKACSTVGTRFLKGYAVPDTALPDLTAQLDAQVAEFDQKKGGFLQQYDRGIEEWIAAHPGYEQVIERSVLSADEVENRLNASYAIFRIGYAPVSQTEGGLNQKVGGICETLYREIETEAREVFQGAFNGTMTRRILRPIDRLLQKLDGLSFLDTGISRLVDALRTTLGALRVGTGPFTGSEAAQVLSVVNLLTSTIAMKEIAAGLKNFTVPSAEDLFGQGTPDALAQPGEQSGPTIPSDTGHLAPVESEDQEEEEAESFFL